MVKKVKESTGKRRPPKWFLPTLTLVLVVLIVSIGTWAMAAPSPQKAVVGKWSNAQGGMINFKADGSGFVPGVTGVISDTYFTYAFPDSTHVRINIAGQDLNVGIKIQGDKMTWTNGYNNTEDVYTRLK